MHLTRVTLLADHFPTEKRYPFNLAVFRETRGVTFRSPVVFFIGENGTGKSTLLEALARKCGIHIWRAVEKKRLEDNPYEEALYRFITVEWTDGAVPGSFFSSEIFRNFAQSLDEWAAASSKILDYFGGKSLMTQSHGQSIMSFFKARYRIKGLYLLDEPETALSPKTQLEFVGLLKAVSQAGHAQFIIATHSPILMACPGAHIFSFDSSPIERVDYEDTEHYRVYRDFMEDRNKFLGKEDVIDDV
jgi:predicted ATPase